MEWNNGLKGGRNAEATTRRKWYGNSLAAALLFPSLLLASRCSLSLELTSQLYAGQNGVSERVANLQISFDRRSVRVRNIRGFGGSFLKA